MNYIINGFHDSILRLVLNKLTDYLDQSECIVIDNPTDKYNLSESISIIDFRDATLGNYVESWENITPLDEKLIYNLRNCELTTLEMMGRLEPHIGTLNYNKRKDIYFKHLRYWNHIILTNDIKYFFSGNIPHENYDYVIYSLCQYYKIKSLFLHQTIPNFIMLLDGIFPFFPQLKKEYENLNKIYFNKNINDIYLEKRGLHIFNSQLGISGNPVPVYMNKIKLKTKIFNISKKLRKFLSKFYSKDFYKNLFNYSLYRIFIYQIFVKRIQFIKNAHLQRYYESKCITPNYNEKYIYFPLHLQPELTTIPLAGAFSNQLLIVQMLNKYLPNNHFIYIKENPKQTKWVRSIEFYDTLYSLSKVKLISKKENTYALLNKSVAVATGTGTAGWEALFRGKSVLMFGNFFYQYARGVFSIKSNNDLIEALKDIDNHNLKPTLFETKKYLKAFENLTIDGCYNSVYCVTNIDYEINSQKIFNAILNVINNGNNN